MLQLFLFQNSIGYPALSSFFLILAFISRGKKTASYEIVMFLNVSHHKMLTVEISFHNGVGEIAWNLVKKKNP